jgi:hypothetical protein
MRWIIQMCRCGRVQSPPELLALKSTLRWKRTGLGGLAIRDSFAVAQDHFSCLYNFRAAGASAVEVRMG